MKKVVIILLVTLGLISCNTKEFNSDEWKNGNARLKGKMVNNLISSKILENKTKDEMRYIEKGGQLIIK
jgi:hypothetical protein